MPATTQGGCRVAMKLWKGTSLSPWVGVFEVEFWNESVHSGNSLRKYCTKWSRTFREFAVPGTRGINIGANIGPVLMSKSSVCGRGILFCNVSSERVEYAAPGKHCKASSTTAAATLHSRIAGCRLQVAGRSGRCMSVESSSSDYLRPGWSRQERVAVGSFLVGRTRLNLGLSTRTFQSYDDHLQSGRGLLPCCVEPSNPERTLLPSPWIFDDTWTGKLCNNRRC